MSAQDVGGIPCLIREIFYAPPCPEEIATLFEVALTHHNTSHYALAVQTYLQAQDLWQTQLTGEYRADDGPNPSPLPTEALLFLRLAIGSVFESAGQDEQALAEYFEGRRQAAAHGLPPNHPTHATLNSAIGAVYVHMSQFDLAADHFLKALDLREQILGPRHVDVGLVLNNIGCCLAILDHTEDALQMYYRAQEIFALHFALEHPRYTTVRRNIQRAKTAYLKGSQFTMPEHKPYKAPYAPGAMRSNRYMAKLDKAKGKKR
mmetsp:Transcript_129600/g.223951  ORF Transcript_129600/g.223951 Transcript_129600/m.223951 type:complete len:262 (-) Transcript_129600:1593-2378(-)